MSTPSRTRNGSTSRLPGGLATALSLLAAATASAEPAPQADWRERPRLTGDWGGGRQWLADHGVELDAHYTAGFWSNLRGGKKTGTRYEGFAQWGLTADLDELVGWKGGGFEINWYSYHGGQPSDELVGLFPVQALSGWETATSVRFFEIFLRQRWGDGRFELKLGQLAADTDFYLSEYSDTLLNATFGFLGLGRERALTPFYPLAAPGVYFRARTGDGRWQAHAGVYTADPGEDTSSNIGFDYSFGNGASFVGEVRTAWSLFGLPGDFSVGAGGTTVDVQAFAGDGIAQGAVGLFAVLDQLVLEQTDTRPGLGVFMHSYGAPQADRSLLAWYVDLGLELTRPLPGRERDVFSLAFACLGFSDRYVDARRAGGTNVTARQSVLEMTYRFQVTGWLALQPDLQFIFDPHFSGRDATVIGLRAVIEL